MTVLGKRPQLRETMRPIEMKPPKEPPQKPVRWIAWTFSIIVLAAAAIAALILTNDSTEPFDEIYEAQSPLAYGARHEPGFDVGFRWVGESDMTLEEYELLQGYEATVGEADRVFERYIDPTAIRPFAPEELAALQATVGEADRVFERYVDPTAIRLFTPEELAALQASVGAADLKYIHMGSTG